MRMTSLLKNTCGALKRSALMLAIGAAVMLGAGLPANAATTTSTINLGAQGSGTTLGGGVKVLKIDKGALPAGSLLRSVAIDAREDSGGGYVGNICVFFAESDTASGILRVGDNYDGGAPDAATMVIWDAGQDYSDGALINKTITTGIPALDLNNYAIFLTSGWTGTWSGTVTITYDVPADPNTLKDFLTFGPGATINTAAGTIAWLVAPGTAVTALVPTYTHNGASASPAAGTSLDFTTPQTYTVTALDSSTQDYTVTVTVAPMPIDGLIVWLKADAVDAGDASQIRVSGNALFVKQWNDQSGNDHHATQTTENGQPQYIANALNGKPVIRFIEDDSNNGDRLFMGDLSEHTPNAGSAFVVATPDEATTQTGYTLFDNRNNDGRWVSGPRQYNESTPGTFRNGRDGSFNTDVIRATWPTSGSHVFAMESSSSVYR